MRIAGQGIALRSDLVRQVRVAHADDVRDVPDVLIDNALVHTPAGGSIAFALGREPGYLVPSISDSGPGVPKDRQAGLFSRKADPGEGWTGMGLFLAARRARLIGGSLTYAGAQLHGATFLLRLRGASGGSVPDPTA